MTHYFHSPNNFPSLNKTTIKLTIEKTHFALNTV